MSTWYQVFNTDKPVWFVRVFRGQYHEATATLGWRLLTEREFRELRARRKPRKVRFLDMTNPLLIGAKRKYPGVSFLPPGLHYDPERAQSPEWAKRSDPEKPARLARFMQEAEEAWSQATVEERVEAALRWQKHQWKRDWLHPSEEWLITRTVRSGRPFSVKPPAWCYRQQGR